MILQDVVLIKCIRKVPFLLLHLGENLLYYAWRFPVNNPLTAFFEHLLHPLLIPLIKGRLQQLSCILHLLLLFDFYNSHLFLHVFTILPTEVVHDIGYGELALLFGDFPLKVLGERVLIDELLDCDLLRTLIETADA